MPLYIDLHIDHTLTPDLVKQCHVADRAIQEKYGVKYVQILLNEPQGYLFCLVEGPDKEACAKVHQEAHGNIACNILEITESDFSALLASRKKNENDVTLNHDGSFDTGTRAILFVDLAGSPEHYKKVNEIIQQAFRQHDGHTAERFGNQLTAIFNSSSGAVDAGLTIRDKISESKLPMEVRMGVSVGPPVKETGDFFEDALRAATFFSFVSANGQITLSTKVMQAYHGTPNPGDSIREMHVTDEKFLNEVMTSIEKVWENNDMTITDFAHEIGMSKSQLARKLKSVSGLSPNDFLKEFRLRKAIVLIEEQGMNIAEVTMATGFTNPSYFTKCFRKRFGKAPSAYLIPA